VVDSKFLDLDEFDVIIIHYSLVIISDSYLSPAFRYKIRRFQGLKIQFIQDDYRWVNQIAAMMRYLGIHILFTLVPTKEISKVWNDELLPGLIKINTLAGYVPDELIGRRTTPIEARPFDIGYRGRILPYWLGQLSQEKVWIAQGIVERAKKYNLRCDIQWREEDRLYGRKWLKFIQSCKAMLGTESGATIADFDGSIEKRVRRYLAEHPEADYWEVRREILEPYEGNARINVISPKIFEAIALRTALILFPGEYSGIIQPWVHYIPLEKDFSNMDQVVERLRDIEFLRDLTERAYGDIIASGKYSYRAFIQEFDEIVSEYGRKRTEKRKVRYHLARLERPLSAPRALVEHYLRATPLFLRVARLLLRGVIALRFALGTRALRTLLFLYLRDHKARGNIKLKHLLRDLLRLGIVQRAQTGTLATGELFQVSVHLNPAKGRLTFVSQRADNPGSSQAVERPSGTSFRSTLESTLHSGRLEMIVWDHSALGDHVLGALTHSRRLKISLGPNGVYRFQALERLIQNSPDRMQSAIMSILVMDNTEASTTTNPSVSTNR